LIVLFIAGFNAVAVLPVVTVFWGAGTVTILTLVVIGAKQTIITTAGDIVATFCLFVACLTLTIARVSVGYALLRNFITRLDTVAVFAVIRTRIAVMDIACPICTSVCPVTILSVVARRPISKYSPIS